MMCTKPQLLAYLERNGLFNVDKTVLAYVKTVMDLPVLFTSFPNDHRRLRNINGSRDYANDNILAMVRQYRGFIETMVTEQKKIQKRHSVNRQ